MICPNCKCEIGNLSVCPYCRLQVQGTKTIPIPNRRISKQNQVFAQDIYQQNNSLRHLHNTDVWGLMSVILLGGIFVLELLQLILQIL